MVGHDTRSARVVVAGADFWSVDELEARLCGDERVEVVGCARDYGELGRLEDLREPDVVLMDRRMYGEDAFGLRGRERSSGLVLLPLRRGAVQDESPVQALEVLDVILGLASDLAHLESTRDTRRAS